MLRISGARQRILRRVTTRSCGATAHLWSSQERANAAGSPMVSLATRGSSPSRCSRALRGRTPQTSVRTPRARPPDALRNDEKPLETQGGEAASRHGESLAFLAYFQGSLLTLLPHPRQFHAGLQRQVTVRAIPRVGDPPAPGAHGGALRSPATSEGPGVLCLQHL
jgi:hypothetical protein